MAAEAMTAEEFWRWFTGSESELFESGDAAPLERELARVHSALRAEVTAASGGKRLVELRAPREAQGVLHELLDRAPALERWVIRKARADLVSFDGITLQRSEVRFTLKNEGARAGIVLSMPGFSDAEYSRYLAIAFRLLDDELGEGVVESDLGTVSMEAPREVSTGLSLERLNQALKEFKEKLRN